MAIAFRSGTITPQAGASGSNLPFTVTAPAGIAAGDVLLAFACIDGAATGGNITTPDADWVSIGSAPHSTFDGQWLHGWRRICTSGNLTWGNFVCTDSSLNDLSAACVAYTGVDNTTPLDAASVSTVNSTGSATPRSMPLNGITTVTANAMVVWAGGIDCNVSNDVTITQPSGFTNREIYGAGGGATLYAPQEVSDQIFASAGATGTLTGSAAFTGGGSAGLVGWVVALRPAAGAAEIIIGQACL